MSRTLHRLRLIGEQRRIKGEAMSTISRSANKQTVERYIDGFNKTDHEQILSCLTDDIEWTVFGWFQLSGKDAYDKEIENPGFTGSPRLTIHRMVEEDDVVMAELG